MRRILLVGDYPPPYGGVSVQLAALSHHLAARGDTDVRVLDIGQRRHERRRECLPARSPLSFAGSVVGHVRSGFTMHVHTNGHNVKSWLGALVCAGAGLAGGRRTVLSLGSGLMPPFLEAAPRSARALVRASLSAAGAVIVRNERARAAVVALGASAAKVAVLSGFYGVAQAELGRLPSGAAPFGREHRPLIGAIASRGPEYGLPLLIDAAARLRGRHPSLGVLLVGPERLEEGCPRWVLPMGECERPSVLAVMQILDVFVRPTYFDGDASSVREALALGVRVVASDTDFRPEGVWRFPCGDADALAQAIDGALVQPAARIDSTSLPALLEIYDALPLDRVRRTAQGAAMASAGPPGPAGRLRVG